MDLSGEEKELRSVSLGYNPNFRESSETLDQHQPRFPDPDRFTGAGEKIEPKSSRSSLKLTPSPATRYRECLKNHAATIGGNVLDGCGEFMPAGEEGTLEALKCAACNCHRNFHRKFLDGDADFGRTIIHPLQLPPPLPSPSLNQHQKSPINVLHHTNHWVSMVQPVKMAFGGSTATDSSSDQDLNFNGFQSNAAVQGAAPPPPPFVLSKKRFRSKFTPDQKEKMLEFAEKVGWRIPREDDVDVQRFCADVGVKRQVFKVWMHNNKNSVKKQQNQES